MLTHPPGSYKPISYEQMYSAVYKWVTFLFTSQVFLLLYQPYQICQVCLQAVQWNSLQGPVQPYEVVDISVDKLNSSTNIFVGPGWHQIELLKSHIWHKLPTYFECNLHYCRTRLAQWSSHLNSVQDEAFIEEFHKVAKAIFLYFFQNHYFCISHDMIKTGTGPVLPRPWWHCSNLHIYEQVINMVI